MRYAGKTNHQPGAKALQRSTEKSKSRALVIGLDSADADPLNNGVRKAIFPRCNLCGRKDVGEGSERLLR